ncbi:hypothetical protein MMC10_006807 [Thelotrema lepadinum]|nr:hypothetical protein [Thelotrema lepadinum]
MKLISTLLISTALASLGLSAPLALQARSQLVKDSASSLPLVGMAAEAAADYRTRDMEAALEAPADSEK